ncbi:MAG: hypothetical protein GXP45_01575 [bacterium]|nr:hypothetical protein [bacterium]
MSKKMLFSLFSLFLLAGLTGCGKVNISVHPDNTTKQQITTDDQNKSTQTKPKEESPIQDGYLLYT